MKNVAVIPNLQKDQAMETTEFVVKWLEKNQCTPLISEQVGQRLGVQGSGREIEEIYRNADFILVLGGDGTFLSVARHAALHNKPILGVNLGTLGFLTEVEKHQVTEALEKVLQGEYTLEQRMMLEASILTQSTTHDTLVSLNDVGITRGAFSRIIDLNIYINDQFVDVFPADGIIIATPTGSTAYNLSAGGPILHPSAEMMVITPICPHTLYSRSFVTSGQDVVKIKIGENLSHDILLTMDGQIGQPLRNNDIIMVRKAKYHTTILKTENLNFYDILRRKIVGIRK